MNALSAVKQNVGAYHNNLTATIIDNMTILELLRWCHYSDSSSYALSLYREGMISKEQAKEFSKFV